MVQSSPAAHPSITLASGHTLHVRIVGEGTLSLLRQAATRELEPERPHELGEGAEPTEEERAAYKKALTEWNDRVNERTGRKTLDYMGNYVVLNETDQEAVDAYRAALAAVGAELPAEETDREIYLWRIVAPTLAEQQRLFNFAAGRRPRQEASAP